MSVLLEHLERKREQLLKHLANVERVALFHEHLRRVRGSRPQTLVACMADVVQSYVSRVESGSVRGIGREALSRILRVYEEMEADNASRH